MSPRTSRSCSPRRVVSAALALIALAAAAGCSRSRAPDRSAIAGDLQHDLELASSSGIELAGASHGSLQVVSALERGEVSAPVRATRTLAPKKSGHRRHAPSPKISDPAPAPAPEVTDAAIVASAAGPATENPAPAAEPEPQPAPVPAPVPVPDGGGDVERGGRGDGLGTAIGTVIGVVIRGGIGGGVDPCDERHGRGRNGGISGMPLPWPGGIDARLPRGTGTFPRY